MKLTEAIRRHVWRRRPVLGTLAALGVLSAALVAAGAGASAPAGLPGPSSPASSCHLGNGVKHVVVLTFDNVHFFRDNPNVPSDLQMMPNLLNFFENNGTFLSNNHTPLIAHTADDILTTLTGLYGDRHGTPIGNSFRAYNQDNVTTDPATGFTYWTDPIDDTAKTPTPGHDTNQSMIYAAQPPATSNPPVTSNTTTPAPWVPWTRAGCDVGAVATANIELENPTFDLPKVFGANSPEAQQVALDPDPFKDQETADYVGVAVHCARNNGICANAQAVKFGQTTPSATETPDLLPDEPGGYNGYEALFGHKYVAPEIGAGAPNVTHNGYQVTNAAGNLVDLNGNQINGAFTSNPGFPGFGPINASQSLAYAADMQEAGIPVTYSYIADIHGNENIPGVSACVGAPTALGSGSPCYIAQAQYYNQAFGTFFQRLAADGITPANTLFILSSDEGDHEAGANVGRAIQPTPANCDGATVSGNTITPDVLCTYPAGTFGELSGNLTGLLATEKGNITPFTLETDTAPEFYLNNNPSPSSAIVRQFDRDVGGLTATNPYTGTTQNITNYLADPAEEAILHMVDADPARTPTLAMFAKPDYFLSTGAPNCNSPCVSTNAGFAYDHGDYAAEIDTNYVGFVGPDVAHLGLDGSGAADGPNSAGPNSGQVTVPGSGTTGTWVDETDIQPTLVYLAGLKDDYVPDGRVISQVLARPVAGGLNAPQLVQLGTCYKQLNSSVGIFGTDTLIASTNALESGSSVNDQTYLTTEAKLTQIDQARDALAGQIKQELDNAEFSSQGDQGDLGQGNDDGQGNDNSQGNSPDLAGQINACNSLLGQAAALDS